MGGLGADTFFQHRRRCDRGRILTIVLVVALGSRPRRRLCKRSCARRVAGVRKRSRSARACARGSKPLPARPCWRLICAEPSSMWTMLSAPSVITWLGSIRRCVAPHGSSRTAICIPACARQRNESTQSFPLTEAGLMCMPQNEDLRGTIDRLQVEKEALKREVCPVPAVAVGRVAMSGCAAIVDCIAAVVE